MILDLRGLNGDEPLKRVREVLKETCPEDEVLEVIVGTEQLAKKMKAFMGMSGCNVELIIENDFWIVKSTGRNCYCS